MGKIIIWELERGLLWTVYYQTFLLYALGRLYHTRYISTVAIAIIVGLFSCRSIDLELNWSSDNGRGWWWPAM